MACTLTAVPYPYTEAIESNVITTPGFEYTSGGWAVDPGAGGTAATARLGPFDSSAHPVPTNRRGGWFLRQTWSVGTSDVSGGPYALVSAITPGLLYTVSAYVRPGRAQRMQLRVAFRNASAVILATATTSWEAQGGAWHRASVTTLPAPAGTMEAVVQVRSVAGTGGTPWVAGDILDIDGVMMTGGAQVRDYFDGDSAATPGVRYSWTGPKGASISWRTIRTATAVAQGVTVERARYNAQRQSAAVLHDVIGRPDPLVSLGPLQARAGTLEVWCADEATAHAVVELYALGRVVMLRDPDHPAIEMYHVPTSVAADPAQERTAPWRWTVSVQFAEVYSTGSLW